MYSRGWHRPRAWGRNDDLVIAWYHAMTQTSLPYPADTPLSLDALRALDIHAILEPLEPVYHEIWKGLSDAARTAIECSDLKQGRVLWLLADVCSMMLDPDNTNEPFRPYAIIMDRRSFAVEDLSAEERDFLDQALDFVGPGLLKARLGDVVWSTKGRRHIRHALAAIDGYATVSLDEGGWYDGGRECITRALMLARAVHKNASDRLEMLETKVFDAVDTAEAQAGNHFPILADLALSFGLRSERSSDLAERLARAAQNHSERGHIELARHCYETARDAYAQAKQPDFVAQMTAGVAQTWVKEAVLRNTGGVMSVIAVSHLEKALQIYRDIPQAYRDELNVNAELSTLRQRIRVEGEKAVAHIPSMAMPGPDVSDAVAQAKDRVRQLPFDEALRVLCNFFPFASKESAWKQAVKSLQSSFFTRMTEAVHFHQSGRVIAKRAALPLGSDASEGHDDTVFSKMVGHHQADIDIKVHAGIIPALAVIREEHCVREIDMVELAKNSTLVPPGRERMVGKGLYWGFAGDFGMAANFLIPQFENIIRYQMHRAGLTISVTNREGIEAEYGLSTLLDVERAEEVLGEDAAFEIQALFCEAEGPNLRNAFAHGLLDDNDFYTAPIVYAWWFILKYISRPYWDGMEAARVAVQSLDEHEPIVSSASD